MSKTNNEYELLEYRMNMLYDYVYNKNSTECYTFQPIIKNDIKLINLKEPEDFDITHIFNGSFKFMGRYNTRYHFKRISETSYPCTVAIGVYKDLYTINDLGSQEIYNTTIMYILSELVINEKNKHILLPLMMFDIVSMDNLKTLQNDIYETLIKNKKIEQVKDDIKLYGIITEHYFKMQTLEEYLNDNAEKMTIMQWKVLFFQIFHTLIKISEKLINFRHNNLNLNAIRLYIKEAKKDASDEIYKIGNLNFNIPNIGFDIKITDFDKCFTTSYIRNKDTKNIRNNSYFDIHYIVSSIAIYLKKNSIKIIDELKNFFDDIIPEKFTQNQNQEFKELDEDLYERSATEILTPFNIIKKNIFFANFINMDLSPSPINEEKIKVSQLKKKENGVVYKKKKNFMECRYAFA